jgi:hypothetical protein
MGNRKRMVVVWLAILMLVLVACSNASLNDGNEQTATVVEPVEPVEPAVEQAETPMIEIEEEEPAIELDTQSLMNDSGKIMLKSYTLNKAGNAGHATIAIVSSSGSIVLADPNSIPHDKGFLKVDGITVSHGHPDHVDWDYMQPYFDKKVEGILSYMKPDKLTVKDIQITGVAAAHTEDAIDEESPRDVIHLYEVDGVRIVHLGDVGQVELTEDQLAKLGKVDILFSNFSNLANYGFGTQKSITIIKQLKPAIVLPLHYEPEVIVEMQQALGINDISDMETLLVDKEDIAKITEMKYVFLK